MGAEDVRWHGGFWQCDIHWWVYYNLSWERGIKKTEHLYIH